MNEVWKQIQVLFICYSALIELAGFFPVGFILLDCEMHIEDVDSTSFPLNVSPSPNQIITYLLRSI